MPCPFFRKWWQRWIFHIMKSQTCQSKTIWLFICLVAMVNASVLLVTPPRRRWSEWKEKAHDECKVKMDEIWLGWCWLKLHRFNDGDMDGLEVLDDSKVLNINIVHIIIKQVDPSRVPQLTCIWMQVGWGSWLVDPTTAEVKTFTRLKPTC